MSPAPLNPVTRAMASTMFYDQYERFQAAARTGDLRSRWFRVSLIWGITLLAEATLRIAAIYLLPIGLAANVCQLLMLTMIGGLVLWTVVSAKKIEGVSRITTR